MPSSKRKKVEPTTPTHEEVEQAKKEMIAKKDKPAPTEGGVQQMLDARGETLEDYRIATDPAPPAAPALPIVYEKLTMTEYSVDSKAGPLTATDLREMLGWETEAQYQARMVAEQGGKAEHYLYGEEYHCLNLKKEKVRLRNNQNNRPFDVSWAEDLTHTVLHFQWAGPMTIPGETVNGETVRISRYGTVLSGQHQGTACVWADEILQADRARKDYSHENRKYPEWDGRDEVCIETIVITGLSTDERVLRTIDYVKPRTAADMLYTMPLFRERSSKDRRHMTRMLSAAIDLLWLRTDTQGYKTHPEIVGFLDRHRRLLKCVEHVARLDAAEPKLELGELAGMRRITKQRISAGHAAALCYLMGCSGPKTDGDAYRNESPPSERGLDWSLLDHARSFWARFAGDRAFGQVRDALADLIDSTPQDDENQGQGGRVPEKLAILAKAWDIYKELPSDHDTPYTDDDLKEGGALRLSYGGVDAKGNRLPQGQVVLLDAADFGGIDWPKKSAGKPTEPMPPAPTPEEIARLSQEALDRRARAGK